MGVVIFVGASVILRLFSLQVMNSSSYQQEAKDQYIKKIDTFDRGAIYFTDKDGRTIAAATIETGFKAAIVPAQITDSEDSYQRINELIPIDKTKFLESMAKKNDPYEEIATRIDQELGDKIVKQDIKGLTLYRDKWRFYPGGTLASKAIGFVSYKDNTLVGSYGLESYYNDVLTRSSGNLSVNFFAELFANVQSNVYKNDIAIGNVITSIEPTVQSELETIVQGIRDKWSSDTAGAIIMDPFTGSIVAMAQVPTFDLNEYNKVDDIGVFTNPFVQNVYEMGSIIKPIVMASAIDAGAVTPQTTYTDKGQTQIDDRTIYNFDKKGRGTINMQEVLSQSLNTGMVFVGQKMGKATFSEYMIDRFRFGEKTGIDLPGEVRGLVNNLKVQNNVNYATASFGQGLATTPINIVRGFAALANGGYLITPHLTSAIEKENGDIEEIEYKKSQAILKPETILSINTMLTKVVDQGYKKGLTHYSVAAKTGTAQVAKPNGQGYYDDRNLHSLIGYFPVSKPRFVVYFYSYYPKNGGRFAIQTLGDSFFDMVQFLANYYEVSPDR